MYSLQRQHHLQIGRGILKSTITWESMKNIRKVVQNRTAKSLVMAPYMAYDIKIVILKSSACLVSETNLQRIVPKSKNIKSITHVPIVKETIKLILFNALLIYYIIKLQT